MSKIWLGVVVAALLGAFVMGAQPACAGPLAWDESYVDPSSAAQVDISTYMWVADFELTRSQRITRVAVWLTDGVANNNGVLDNFSGVLSWGLFRELGSAPPWTIASGASEAVLQQDTGLQDASNRDVVRVWFDLDLPVVLAPGWYWIGIHEGAWGAPGDGSAILWSTARTRVAGATYGTTELADPYSWDIGPYLKDPAFVVLGDEVAANHQGLNMANLWGDNISNWVTANDFQATAGDTVASVDVWLADGLLDDNNVLNYFSGALSWAIYHDDGNARPGTLAASGNCATVDLVMTDLQTTLNSDVAAVHCTFDQQVPLASATYWLALHEGPWLSAYDGTSVYWVFGVVTGPTTGQWQDSTETAPGSWNVHSDLTQNAAFILRGPELAFASGFDAGVTCGWSFAAGGVCP